MIIGVDIDDVITSTSELIMEYAMKYYKSNDVDLINNILHGNTIDEKLMSFYNENLIEMQKKYKLKDNVKEVIDRLRSKGHKIIIISARGNTQVHEAIGKLDQKTTTLEYLRKHEILFDKIVFKARYKKEECIKNSVDIMIDDSIMVLNELKGTNIKHLLYESISNKDFNTNFDMVSNWLELEKYINSIS